MIKRILKRKYLLLILLLIGYGIYFFSQITLESHLPLAEQPRVAAILGAEDNVFWKLIWQSVLEEAANQEMLLSRYPLPDNSSLSDAYDALETAEIADVDGVLCNIMTRVRFCCFPMRGQCRRTWRFVWPA